MEPNDLREIARRIEPNYPTEAAWLRTQADIEAGGTIVYGEDGIVHYRAHSGDYNTLCGLPRFVLCDPEEHSSTWDEALWCGTCQMMVDLEESS